jgi:hypothetical protein
MEERWGYVAGSSSRAGSNPGAVGLANDKKVPRELPGDGKRVGGDLDGGKATSKYRGGVLPL